MCTCANTTARGEIYRTVRPPRVPVPWHAANALRVNRKPAVLLRVAQMPLFFTPSATTTTSTTTTSPPHPTATTTTTTTTATTSTATATITTITASTTAATTATTASTTETQHYVLFYLSHPRWCPG